MEEASLFALPEGMRVEQIQITEQGLVIDIKEDMCQKNGEQIFLFISIFWRG